MTPSEFDALPVRVKEEMIATVTVENMLMAVSYYVPDKNEVNVG